MSQSPTYGLVCGVSPVVSGYQRSDVSVRFRRASRNDCTISCALRLSKSISLRVNMRGAGHLPSFLLSKAVEGVKELPVSQPCEVSSVFVLSLIRLTRLSPLYRVEQTTTSVTIPVEKERTFN